LNGRNLRTEANPPKDLALSSEDPGLAKAVELSPIEAARVLRRVLTDYNCMFFAAELLTMTVSR
jgi:hypothetical protein